MNTLRSRVAAIGIATLTAVALSACMQEAAPTSQVDAEAQLCTSLAAFGTALGGLAGSGSDDIVSGRREAARDAIQVAWDQVKEDAAAVPDADETAVNDSWQTVVNAVDNIATDVPIEEALVPVQEAVDDVQANFDEMRDGVGCRVGRTTLVRPRGRDTALVDRR